jgi:NAD(P)-dependent dehydrogenase (short-subunit alcohol dehydrogenase family)
VADLSDLAGLVERSVAHFGALDGVVNNAGLHVTERAC